MGSYYAGSAAETDPTAIPKTLLDAKGDLIAASAADTAARLAVGANNTVLTADSAEATGVKWAAASGIDLAWTGNPNSEHTAQGIPDGTNRACYVRVTQGAATVSKLGIMVGNSTGNICLGVYSNTGAGTSAAPATRLATTGATACPAAGFREIALNVTVAVTAGMWFALSADSTASTFYRFLTSGVAIVPFMCCKEAAGYPLPTTAGTLAANDRPYIIVGIP